MERSKADRNIYQYTDHLRDSFVWCSQLLVFLKHMIEYEALFTDINKEALRKLLQEKGAVLMRQEFLQKRVTLQLPEGHEKYGAFLRVRDEGDKITLSYKYVGGTTIDEQQEEAVLVNDFDKTVSLLHTISCNSTSYE